MARARKKAEEDWDGSIICGNALPPTPRAVAVRASDPAVIVPPPFAAIVEDALEAALRVVGDRAHYIDALDSAIDYLRGIRDYEAANLAAELAATGHATSTRIVPGKKIGLRAHNVIVCACHGVSPFDCPNIERVTIATPGTKLYLDKNE